MPDPDLTDTRCAQHDKTVYVINWSRPPGIWSYVRFHCGCEMRNAEAPENAEWMRENYPDFVGE